MDVFFLGKRFCFDREGYAKLAIAAPTLKNDPEGVAHIEIGTEALHPLVLSRQERRRSNFIDKAVYKMYLKILSTISMCKKYRQ